MKRAKYFPCGSERAIAKVGGRILLGDNIDGEGEGRSCCGLSGSNLLQFGFWIYIYAISTCEKFILPWILGNVTLRKSESISSYNSLNGYQSTELHGGASLDAEIWIVAALETSNLTHTQLLYRVRQLRDYSLPYYSLQQTDPVPCNTTARRVDSTLLTALLNILVALFPIDDITASYH